MATYWAQTHIAPLRITAPDVRSLLDALATELTRSPADRMVGPMTQKRTSDGALYVSVIVRASGEAEVKQLVAAALTNVLPRFDPAAAFAPVEVADWSDPPV